RLKRGCNLGFLPQTKTANHPYVYSYFVILSAAKDLQKCAGLMKKRRSFAALRMTFILYRFHGFPV
ncbi:MAG: hypothetical protein J7M12_05315, partial [Candidatus Hydrogenedentes bacterium]|nr:hypothetical protein [Candidatus Hydrogenedentota bacterium]